MGNGLGIIQKFKGKRILIIGDVMLDKYILGEVNRINPEAPVPIVDVKEEKFVPGGAANVANNVASLSGNAVLAGIVGKDSAGEILMGEMKARNIDVSSSIIGAQKQTTQKVRILGQSQQLLRVDYESKESLGREDESAFMAMIEKAVRKADAIIVSDYAKGTISHGIVELLRPLAKTKTIIIDPKPMHASWYHGFTLITPNTKEAMAMAGRSEDGGMHHVHIHEVGKLLGAELQANILITRGEHGMSLFEKGGRITDIPTKAKEVYDVSGAGDTVVAVLALALCSGASLHDAAALANIAAGIKVGKRGTAPVMIDELKKALETE